jgi:hypothetical protein
VQREDTLNTFTAINSSRGEVKRRTRMAAQTRQAQIVAAMLGGRTLS